MKTNCWDIRPAAGAAPGRRNRFFGEDLFDDFFREMPALGSGTPEETPKAEEKTVSEEESGHFAQIRQRNALRHELKKAIHEENFERAAEIRDELRAMEGKDENKAS